MRPTPWTLCHAGMSNLIVKLRHSANGLIMKHFFAISLILCVSLSSGGLGHRTSGIIGKRCRAVARTQERSRRGVHGSEPQSFSLVQYPMFVASRSRGLVSSGGHPFRLIVSLSLGASATFGYRHRYLDAVTFCTLGGTLVCC